MNALLDEALAAAGGLDRWRAAAAITARVRSGGLALRMKGVRQPFASYEARVFTDRPRTELRPYPRAGSVGVFTPDRVAIERDDGSLVEAREHPRGYFPGGRRALRWDHLDALYFAGYALWNYLTTPLLLTFDGVAVRPGATRTAEGERWRALEVEFPPELPTHSREQTFWFGDDGLLRRLEYTAEPIGGWARAAHATRAQREFDGLVFPTRRRVTPRSSGGTARRWPVLIWIDLELVTVTPTR